MFERFTDRARRVLAFAQEEARLLNHSFIGTEHILLGLSHEGEGLAAKVLESLGISLEAIRDRVQETIGPAGSAPAGSPPFTPRAKKVLELSLREALQLGHNYIGTEHMLLGLTREGEGVAATVLQSLGAELPHVRQRVIEMLSGSAGRDFRSGARHGSGAEWPHGPEWPRVPTKVVGGPGARLVSEGLEFSITGVLFFAEHVQVSWGLSGISSRIMDLMGDSRLFSANAQRGDPVAYLALADDVATTYRLVGAQLAKRSESACVASSLFTPSPSDTATVLRVSWGGESIAVRL